MAPQALTTWINKIAPDVRGCPNPVIKDEVLWTARDFCKETQLLIEELTAIDVVEDQAEYTLAPTGGEIVAIDHVEFDEVRILPVTIEYMDKTFSQWRTTTTTTPMHFLSDYYNKIRLVFIPEDDLTAGLVVWVSIKPLKTATTLDAFLYDNHFETLADGARARIMAMPKRPWTDAAQSSLYQAKYEMARDAAKLFRHTGHVNMGCRINLRGFAL